MALKAGRVGVNPRDVDPQGHVLNGGGSGDTFVPEYKSVNVTGVRRTKTATSKSGGFVFEVGPDNLIIYGFRLFARGTTAKIYISSDASTHLVEKEATGLTASAWNVVLLDNPVTLTKNTQYTVWYTEADGLNQQEGVIPNSMFGVIDHVVYNDSANTFPETTPSSVYCYSLDMLTKILIGGIIE